MNILFVYPNKDASGYKPLGLSVLMALAKGAGHNIRLFDTTYYNLWELEETPEYATSHEIGVQILNYMPTDLSPYNCGKTTVDVRAEFEKVLSEFKPDCLAISLLSSEEKVARRLSEICKEVLPDCFVMAGGKHCIVDGDNVMRWPSVDAVCISEADSTFLPALEAVAAGKDLSAIPGFISRMPDGKIVKNRSVDYFRSLDSLPQLDWSMFDSRQFIKPFLGKVMKGGDHMLMRGCYESCSYCIQATIHEMHDGDKSLRRYTPERIVMELAELKKKWDLTLYRFHDETFLSWPLKEFREVATLYAKHVGLPFSIEVSPQSVTEEKAYLLKEMGCVSVSVGVETANEEYRKKYLFRKQSNKTVVTAFERLRKNGLRTVAFLLAGFPNETREMIFETISLMREAKVNSPTLAFVYPFKGTAIRDIAIKLGMFDPSVEEKLGFAFYQKDRPAINNPCISLEEYQGISRTFLLYCKLPESFFPKIRLAESFTPEGEAALVELANYYRENNLYA